MQKYSGLVIALVVFGIFLLFACVYTGCNSDFGIPATSTDMGLAQSDLAKLATPDMAEQKLDLALTPDLAEVLTVTDDLATSPDMVTTPDLVPDPCASRFHFNSASPPRLTQVIGTSQNIVGTITVDNITSAMDPYTIHDTVFLEFSTSTGLIPDDLQHLKLLQNGKAVTVDLPQCRQNGMSISCSLPLVQPIVVQGKISFDLVADIGLPGQARLGDSFMVFAGSPSLRITSKGNDVDFNCASAGFSLRENIIVPFLVNVTVDWPAANSKEVLAIRDETQIGRLKIENTGHATATPHSVKIADYGSHTGNTTTYSLFYSDENSKNYTSNPAVKDSLLNFGIIGDKKLATGGKAYRYTTIGIANIGKVTYGDTFQLGVAKLGDITYTSTELDLGYDANLDGVLGGDTVPLPVGTTGSFPVQLGTLEKQ